MHEEIKNRLNLGNSGYHSVQSLLSSGLLSRNLKVKIYKTIILPIVLYGCEIWYLSLREEHRLRVFENRVLRRIFGPKTDGVTGEQRKVHIGELHNLYSSPDIIRQIKSRRMTWAEKRGPKESGHSKDRGVDRRMGFEWILGRLGGVCVCVEWIHMAEDRDLWQVLANAAMNLGILSPWS
jgi:hypothetical protein